MTLPAVPIARENCGLDGSTTGGDLAGTDGPMCFLSVEEI